MLQPLSDLLAVDMMRPSWPRNTTRAKGCRSKMHSGPKMKWTINVHVLYNAPLNLADGFCSRDAVILSHPKRLEYYLGDGTFLIWRWVNKRVGLTLVYYNNSNNDACRVQFSVMAQHYYDKNTDFPTFSRRFHRGTVTGLYCSFFCPGSNNNPGKTSNLRGVDDTSKNLILTRITSTTVSHFI